jgi:hypothetical protein
MGLMFEIGDKFIDGVGLWEITKVNYSTFNLHSQYGQIYRLKRFDGRVLDIPHSRFITYVEDGTIKKVD